MGAPLYLSYAERQTLFLCTGIEADYLLYRVPMGSINLLCPSAILVPAATSPLNYVPNLSFSLDTRRGSPSQSLINIPFKA